MNTPDPAVWTVYQTTHVRPRYFTGEAWAMLTPNQREVIRRQRMGVVEALRLDHETRYHHADRRADELATEIDAWRNS